MNFSFYYNTLKISQKSNNSKFSSKKRTFFNTDKNDIPSFVHFYKILYFFSKLKT